MKVGHVPVMPYFRPGNPALAAQVKSTLNHYAQQGKIVRALMLPKLGPNVWHDSLSQAMAMLEELEETAKLYQTCSPKPTGLSDAEIADLRTHFNASW
jgi:ribulose-5-phosphate 4-epimerase/fuculose-1-phosphate aldolase